jgi:hypothetical protein
MTRKPAEITSIDDAAEVRWLEALTERDRARTLAGPAPDTVARMRLRVMTGVVDRKPARRAAA